MFAIFEGDVQSLNVVTIMAQVRKCEGIIDGYAKAFALWDIEID